MVLPLVDLDVRLQEHLQVGQLFNRTLVTLRSLTHLVIVLGARRQLVTQLLHLLLIRLPHFTGLLQLLRH